MLSMLGPRRLTHLLTYTSLFIHLLRNIRAPYTRRGHMRPGHAVSFSHTQAPSSGEHTADISPWKQRVVATAEPAQIRTSAKRRKITTGLSTDRAVDRQGCQLRSPHAEPHARPR